LYDSSILVPYCQSESHYGALQQCKG
jgi:hypothetical protein